VSGLPASKPLAVEAEARDASPRQPEEPTDPPPGPDESELDEASREFLDYLIEATWQQYLRELRGD